MAAARPSVGKAAADGWLGSTTWGGFAARSKPSCAVPRASRVTSFRRAGLGASGRTRRGGGEGSRNGGRNGGRASVVDEAGVARGVLDQAQWRASAPSGSGSLGPDEAEQFLRIEAQLPMTVSNGAGDERPDERDGQIAEGRHGLWAVAGTRATPVLVIGDVADVVQRLDGPVTAQQGQDLGLACTVERQAGYPEDDFTALLAVAERGGALNPKGLGGVREAQACDVLR